MSILTGLVIVVAMATLAQKSDTLIDYFFTEKSPGVAPQNDAVAVVAGKSQIIDVLANDEGVTPEDAANVRILVSPSCGAAEATASGVLYIPNDRCVGDQLFAYCVQRGDECSSASVTVSVLSSEPQRLVVGAQPTPSTDNVSQVPRELLNAGDQADRIVAGARQGLAPVERIVAPEDSNDAISAPRLALAPLRENSPANGNLGAEPAIQLRVDGGVAAAVRPIQPTQTNVGRLASAPGPAIGSDDGGLMDLLRDDSEPRIGQANAPRLADPFAGSGANVDGAVEAVDDGLNPVRVATLAPAEVEAEDRTEDRIAPDVSAIKSLQPAEEEEEVVEVASVDQSDGDETRGLLQNEAINALNNGVGTQATAKPETAEAPVEDEQPADTLIASIPTVEPETAVLPTTIVPKPADVAEGCGPVVVSSFAAPGAASQIAAFSSCRAGQVALFSHAGFEFPTKFDRDGKAQLTLPVLDYLEGVEVLTSDGVRTRSELVFNEAELDLALRIAVGWTTPVDLDLHVFEYSAGFGDAGHIWQQNPRRFRDVRRSGGGYLSTFQALTPGGQSIEVYTFWANSRARDGYARVAVDHASRGDQPSGAYCGRGVLATPDYSIVRAERGVVWSRSQGQFAAARCGARLSNDARYAGAGVKELKISGR
ncbi:MAG: hypothetical protein ACPGGK_10660 [Pikeienuella sp.]